MSLLRITRGSVATFGRRIGVLTLVLALNISFSSLPAAVAYADTLSTEEPLTAVSVSDEEVEVVENETILTTETESVSTQEVQAVSVETSELSTSPEPSMMVATEEAAMLDTEPKVEYAEAPSLTADFDCWTRTSANGYSFLINVTTPVDVTLDGDTQYNSILDGETEALLPTMFTQDTTSVEVMDWDGNAFTWALGQSKLDVTLDAAMCAGPTIAELAQVVPELSTLNSVIAALQTSPSCDATIAALVNPEAGLTVFAPTNDAFASLVSSPETSAEEISQLLSNLDELCALIQSHVVVGEVVSTDASSTPVTLPALGNDLDGLTVQLVDGLVMVDDSTVVAADNFAVNGVVHLIDSVLLPSSIGTIDAVETDMTSPALSGTIGAASMHATTVCVVVRVDGTPYLATVENSSWTIAEGTVMLNPTKTDTLFDIIIRESDAICENQMYTMNDEESPMFVQNRGNLLGLTMTTNVVTFMAEIEEPTEEVVIDTDGDVLGIDTEVEEAVIEEAVYVEPIYYAGTDFGKGGAAVDSEETDPSKIDTDGDGVVDSEDPEPNNPDVTGLEDPETTDEDDTDTTSDNNVFWWFVAGGGAVSLWYLLWQRSGREF